MVPLSPAISSSSALPIPCSWRASFAGGGILWLAFLVFSVLSFGNLPRESFRRIHFTKAARAQVDLLGGCPGAICSRRSVTIHSPSAGLEILRRGSRIRVFFGPAEHGRDDPSLSFHRFSSSPLNKLFMQAHGGSGILACFFSQEAHSGQEVVRWKSRVRGDRP